VDGMTQWREERDHAVAARAAALARLQEAESSLAQELIAEFVDDALKQGLPATQLKAYAYTGNARYRTSLTGWYLNADKTIAVDVNGNYYNLGVPATLKARFSGVEVKPEPPKLIVGQGGRDGESMPLKDLLRIRLIRPHL
jgi:hypothetical protein